MSTCLAPCYFNELCIPVSTVPNLSVLHSPARVDLFIRRRLQLGNRAFCVTGSVAWNSLPLEIYFTATINFQKHAQDTSFLTFLIHRLTVSQSTSSKHCMVPL